LEEDKDKTGVRSRFTFSRLHLSSVFLPSLLNIVQICVVVIFRASVFSFQVSPLLTVRIRSQNGGRKEDVETIPEKVLVYEEETFFGGGE
jgi:hypothetical protein